MKEGTPPPGQPVAFGPWVSYPKEEVFEICGALALAEAVLVRAGSSVEAARMAVVFRMVEDRLAMPTTPDRTSAPTS